MSSQWYAPALVPSTVPGQRKVSPSPSSPPVDFPLVLVPSSPSAFKDRSQVLAWLSAHKSDLEAALELHGAVLFRGLPGLNDAQDFDAFGKSLSWGEFAYVNGAAPRTKVFGSVYTTNEGPADTLIGWHNEVSQSISPPARLIFACEVAAQSGGATSFLYGPEAYLKISEAEPDFVTKLGEKGIVYVREMSEETNHNLNNGRGWKDSYNVKTKEELAVALEKLKVTYEWTPSGNLLTYSPPLPGTRANPKTNLPVWFNSIGGAFIDTTVTLGAPSDKGLQWGDRSAPEHAQLQRIFDLLEGIRVDVDWQAGDVVVVNNHLALHARRPYAGKRKVYASLWAA
ncbi:hypothetical protein BJ742DRAFT_133531 [Cladochytrium replicatum]|nr:hypothetical protein BJ742DRAFT_133531 [Cladochytrium replicatum]